MDGTAQSVDPCFARTIHRLFHTNSARASAIAQTPECAIIARAFSCTHVASNAAIASSGDQLTATLSKSDDHG